MATFRMSILGFSTKPDSSGDVFPEPQSVKGTNDFFDQLVYIFNDSGTKIGLYGSFEVPENYVGGAKFVPAWDTTATSGDVEWDIDYRAVAAGESVDQATAQEALNQNDTAGGSAHLLQVAELSATAGNFSPGDLVQYIIYRDGVDAGDTIAASVRLLKLNFEWTN
tara:strand:- start:1265 stop:1762 length:498 start_codon:yes stop_codon:yes gene_type:complete